MNPTGKIERTSSRPPNSSGSPPNKTRCVIPEWVIIPKIWPTWVSPITKNSLKLKIRSSKLSWTISPRLRSPPSRKIPWWTHQKNPAILLSLSAITSSPLSNNNNNLNNYNLSSNNNFNRCKCKPLPPNPSSANKTTLSSEARRTPSSRILIRTSKISITYSKTFSISNIDTTNKFPPSKTACSSPTSRKLSSSLTRSSNSTPHSPILRHST